MIELPNKTAFGEYFRTCDPEENEHKKFLFASFFKIENEEYRKEFGMNKAKSVETAQMSFKNAKLVADFISSNRRIKKVLVYAVGFENSVYEARG